VRTETRDASGAVIFEASPVVRHLAQFEALAALGLFEYLELGVAFPVALVDSADDTRLATYTYTTSANLSDLRLSAKVPLFRGEVGVAARFVASLPTGWWENYSGMEYWVATPSLVFAWDPGPLTVSAESAIASASAARCRLRAGRRDRRRGRPHRADHPGGRDHRESRSASRRRP